MLRRRCGAVVVRRRKSGEEEVWRSGEEESGSPQGSSGASAHGGVELSPGCRWCRIRWRCSTPPLFSSTPLHFTQQIDLT